MYKNNNIGKNINGDIMRNTKYNKIADKYKPDEDKIKNAYTAFVTGGILGLIAEGIIELFCRYLNYSRSDSSTIMLVIFIFVACLFTALGFFDKLVNKYRCGLLIPITGFAHSMMSSCLDYKSEGPIYGMGSNIFKLAGSVILYGVVSAWFFGMIRYLIGGIG